MDTLLILSVVMLTTVFFISDVGGVSLNVPVIRKQYKETRRTIIKEKHKIMENAKLKRRSEEREVAGDGNKTQVTGQKLAGGEAAAAVDKAAELKRHKEDQARQQKKQRAPVQILKQHRPQDKYKREWNTREKDAL
ncbi:uncharacterized protein LOC128224349 [Mya arenaria]|uniref:uncharacterized protein LOC128224349 n=1 Tax=Mya arenaria TaxID=6604 RepID=UPI0022E20512|nr:uncharacterized protein LOC128224349 [Mya arenaria]